MPTFLSVASLNVSQECLVFLPRECLREEFFKRLSQREPDQLVIHRLVTEEKQKSNYLCETVICELKRENKSKTSYLKQQ